MCKVSVIRVIITLQPKAALLKDALGLSRKLSKPSPFEAKVLKELFPGSSYGKRQTRPFDPTSKCCASSSQKKKKAARSSDKCASNAVEGLCT